jgi:thiol-disulfide isomerase/thioredoxin
MWRFILGLSLAIILFLWSGCSTRNQNSSRKKEDAEIIIRQALPYPVEMIDQKGLDRYLTERKGKILLLNIWATWCQPCVEEFPDLITLAQRDTLVEVIGISVDYPDEIPSKVIPFLEKLKVPFKVYVAKFEKQEDFIATLDSTWSGAIPATFIYDRIGMQQFSHIGIGSFRVFEKRITEIKNGVNINNIAKIQRAAR